jgi:transcriptional regulator with XRE-family HTH domain
MSQERLADELGLTFQQVQKYERGTNRVGSSRLYELSKILDVPIQYFFDEMPDDIAATARGSAVYIEGARPEYEPDTLAKRETLELVRAYYKIRHPRVRKKVFDLAKALARSEELT